MAEPAAASLGEQWLGARASSILSTRPRPRTTEEGYFGARSTAAAASTVSESGCASGAVERQPVRQQQTESTSQAPRREGGGNEEEEAQKKYKEKEKEKSWLRWLAGWLEGWRLTGEGRRTVGREKGGRTKDLPVDYLLAGEAQLRSGPLTAQLGPRFDGRPRAPPRAALRERQCRESRAGQPSMRLQRFATVAEPKTAASQSSNYLRGEGLRAGAWTACLGAGVDRY